MWYSENSTPLDEAQDYRLIPLGGKRGQGVFAKVSPHRFAYLSQFRWFLTTGGYAIRSRRKGEPRPVFMHREITNRPADRVVDHVDGDPLNNTDENLRVVTQAQNVQNVNKRKSAEASSFFRGVYYHKQNRKWIARIHHKGQDLFLGSFESEEEAARARDGAVIALRGEFGALSIPQESPIPFSEPRSRIKTSRSKGIAFDRSRGKWMAFVTEGRRFINLGRFASEEEAIKARETYLEKKG